MRRRSSEEELREVLVRRAEGLIEELERVFDRLYRLGFINEFMLGEVDACVFTLRRVLEVVRRGELEEPLE